MPRVCLFAIVLLIASGSLVQADDQTVAKKPLLRRTAAGSDVVQPRQPKRQIPHAVGTPSGRVLQGEKEETSILAPLDRPKGSARKTDVEPSGWSIAPKWSAANGGGYAAYGTRALLNEMQSNPAETSGYGAGAKLDFHF